MIQIQTQENELVTIHPHIFSYFKTLDTICEDVNEDDVITIPLTIKKQILLYILNLYSKYKHNSKLKNYFDDKTIDEIVDILYWIHYFGNVDLLKELYENASFNYKEKLLSLVDN